MADDIFTLLDQQRAFLSTLDRATSQRMTVAYQRVLRQARSDYRSFNQKLYTWKVANPTADPQGSSPSRHWVFQQERYKRLISQLERNLTYYTRVSQASIEDAQRAAMARAQDDNGSLIRASLGGDERSQSNISLAVLPDDAIEAVVGITSDGTPLAELLRQRARSTASSAGQDLVTGVALGHSPQKVADHLDDQLNTLHWQNLRLSRTEMMRAYREAQRVNMLQNSDVIAGWKWSSALDKRSCPICLGQHGKTFPLQHVAPGDVPPDTAQHKGLSDTFATAPTETAVVG